MHKSEPQFQVLATYSYDDKRWWYIFSFYDVWNEMELPRDDIQFVTNIVGAFDVNICPHICTEWMLLNLTSLMQTTNCVMHLIESKQKKKKRNKSRLQKRAR